MEPPSNPFFEPSDRMIHLGHGEPFQLDLYNNPGQFLIDQIAKTYRELLDIYNEPYILKEWKQEIKDMFHQILVSVEDFFENKPMGFRHIEKFKFPIENVFILDELDRLLKEMRDDWMIHYPHWPAFGFEHIMPKPRMD
jgi:hypothetical protein